MNNYILLQSVLKFALASWMYNGFCHTILKINVQLVWCIALKFLWCVRIWITRDLFYTSLNNYALRVQRVIIAESTNVWSILWMHDGYIAWGRQGDFMLQDQHRRDITLWKMSETAPTNDVPESNGTMEQPTYNGEAEEHVGKLTYSI